MSLRTSRSPRSLGSPPWLLAVLLLGVLMPAQVLAAEVRQGEMVVVGPDEVIEEDLYAFGSSVLIQGTVRGDVVAAARSVDISGTVEGDVLSMAGDVRVGGQVQGSVRSAAGTLRVAGQVGEDGVLAGGEVSLEPGAQVGRDLFLAAGDARVQAPVGGDLQVAAGALTVGAPVSGNVHADVETLALTEAASIGGSLRYRSENEAELASGATVAGSVERSTPERQLPGPVAYVVGWARWLVGLFALGLLLVLLTPDFARRASATLRQSPWRSLGWGALAFLGTPFLAALVFLLGVLIGGWWIGLLALGLYLLALALCFPVVGMFLGRWLLDRFGKAGTSLVLALLLGLVLLTLAGTVPVLGGVIVLATLLFGLGALVIAAASGRRPALAT